jgi:hypothetical protein
VRFHDRDDGTLVVDDAPVLHWLLALLFVGVGGLFVVGPLGVFTDADRLRWWVRAAIAAVGSLGVIVGGWVLARAPRSRLTVRPAPAAVRLQRWGLRGRAGWEWPRAAVTGVQLVQGADDEGGAVFQLHLLLRDARPVPLSIVWTHDRAGLERVARRLAAVTGGRTVNVRGPDADAALPGRDGGVRRRGA